MIEIVDVNLETDLATGNSYWICHTEITRDGTTYEEAAIAPSILAKVELQAWLDAREDELWRDALIHRRIPDLIPEINSWRLLWRVLKAIALVMFDEINVLRQALGLPQRTKQQLKQAIRQKLAEE